jgi:hypothetical protein
MKEIWLTRRELRNWMVRSAGSHYIHEQEWRDNEIEMLREVIRDYYPAHLYYHGKPVSVPHSFRGALGRCIGVKYLKANLPQDRG